MEHTLPPGKYFIGNPAFVLDDRTECEIMSLAHGYMRDEVVIYRDLSLWAYLIKSDLEIFTDQNGVEYESRPKGSTFGSKILGAIPIDLVENPAGEEHGTILDAPDGLKVSFYGGVFTFGDISISTQPPPTGPFDGGYDLNPDDDQIPG